MRQVTGGERRGKEKGRKRIGVNKDRDGGREGWRERGMEGGEGGLQKVSFSGCVRGGKPFSLSHPAWKEAKNC